MMSRTIEVSEKTYQRAEKLAALIHQDVDEILTMLLEVSLPLIPEIDVDRPIPKLSDADILALSQLQMQPDADQRHSELLAQQNARPLHDSERIELNALMHVYEIGMLYKAQALEEAVRRNNPKNLTYYLNLPYSIRLVPDEDGTWFAEIPELPGCMTVGDSKLDALDMLEDAKLTWISGALLAGDVIPEQEKMHG